MQETARKVSCFQTKDSLRSKRFRLVSEQRNTEEGDFRFWPREKWNESQKMKEGGEGGEGRKPSFLPHPLPALLLGPLFSRSLTLVPRSFRLNRTETLATQARQKIVHRILNIWINNLNFYHFLHLLWENQSWSPFDHFLNKVPTIFVIDC